MRESLTAIAKVWLKANEDSFCHWWSSSYLSYPLTDLYSFNLPSKSSPPMWVDFSPLSPTSPLALSQESFPAFSSSTTLLQTLWSASLSHTHDDGNKFCLPFRVYCGKISPGSALQCSYCSLQWETYRQSSSMDEVNTHSLLSSVPPGSRMSDEDWKLLREKYSAVFSPIVNRPAAHSILGGR